MLSLTPPASAPASPPAPAPCACGCGQRLFSGMIVVWVAKQAYAQGCVSFGPYETPAAALRGLRS